MTLKEFVNLARGVNEGENLPIDNLKILYRNISVDPLAVHEIERR